MSAVPTRHRIAVAALAALAACADPSSAPVRTSNALNQGTLVHLPLDEGAGELATDASGNGHHGAVVGGAVWGQGGLRVDGSRHIDVGLSPSLQALEQLTAAVWIKPDTCAPWNAIVALGDREARFALYVDERRHLRFGVDLGSIHARNWDAAAALELGRWHHVAATYDGNDLKFFIDGALDATHAVGPLALDASGAPLRWGADLPHPRTGGGSFAGGRLDAVVRDARVHDRALDATAIGELAADLAPRPLPAFLDGVMPRRAPGSASGVDVAPALANLRFDDPLVIRAIPRSNRLCIGSRQGLLETCVDDPQATAKEIFLDLRAQCAEVFDGGLLGVAFHPSFGVANAPGRGHLFVLYCYTPDGNYPREPIKGFFGVYLRLARFTVPDGATTADLNSQAVLFDVRLYNDSHRGGDLAFGTDGLLYVTIGDQFRYETAQQTSDNFDGGVLRLDVDRDANRSHPPRRTLPQQFPDEVTGQNYWIPDDNPFLDPSGARLEEYCALGLRNPFRISVDPVNGRIWCADVGGDQRDEVDIIELGHNYGWPFREGTIPGPRPRPPTVIGIVTEPVLDFTRSQSRATIGGYVYRGSTFTTLVGDYLCGDHRLNRIFAISYDETTGLAESRVLTGFAPQNLTTFGTDHSGEILFGHLERNATLHRLVATGSTQQPPDRLSDVGAFRDLTNLEPSAGVLPYELAVPFWSDGAEKHRWVAIPGDGAHDTPAETIAVDRDGTWTFPRGTVWIKHFELPIDERDPSRTRRLETRFLVFDEEGGFYGVTYRWRPDGSDADLLAAGFDEDIAIATARGPRVQRWTYPSREDCTSCHQPASGGVLGPSATQLNADFTYAAGASPENQLHAWNRLGLFDPPLTGATLASMPTAAPVEDPTLPIEDRARAYLDSNCASCHRPQTANRAAFDARLSTPLAAADLLAGPLLDDLGIPGAALLLPGDPDRSITWRRLATLDATAMPPLSKNRAHEAGIELLRQWIWSLDPDAATIRLGAPIDNLPSIDAAWHTMVIDEASAYTNATGGVQHVRVAGFRFWAAATAGAMTPFVVRVRGDDDFVVLAIGTPRRDDVYRRGANVFRFADDGAVRLALQPGETIAGGFLDANPDGSGGADGAIVPYCTCNATGEVWTTGGIGPGDAGRVETGRAPIAGALTFSTARTYAFSVDLCACTESAAARLGNPVGAQTGRNAWTSNLVIDVDDTYTNTDTAPQTIAIESFEWFAHGSSDPLTPFVVRVESDGSFTVVAVGATLTGSDVGPGARRRWFDPNGPVSLTLAPGETLAAGFLDAAADGSGGGAGSVVAFALGRGDTWRTGGPAAGDAGTVEVGRAPQPGAVSPFLESRSYAFAIHLRRAAPGATVILGHAISDREHLDPNAAQLILDRDAAYTNASGRAQRITVESFRFWARSAGGPLTPLVAKSLGGAAFRVVAIGTTRRDYAAGDHTATFDAAGPAEIILGPGETLVPGFSSAFADGHGALPAAIPYSAEGEVWMTGGPDRTDAGRVRWGSAPIHGRQTSGEPRTDNGADLAPVSAVRRYSFAIGFRVD